jgi:hypothetical protein
MAEGTPARSGFSDGLLALHVRGHALIGAGVGKRHSTFALEDQGEQFPLFQRLFQAFA